MALTQCLSAKELHSRDSYLTLPEVFLSTEAAKLWVTPTKLMPSTSTIRSFTWILDETEG